MNLRETLIANAVDDAIAGMKDGNLELVEICGSVIAHQSRMLKLERDVATLELNPTQENPDHACALHS